MGVQRVESDRFRPITLTGHEIGAFFAWKRPSGRLGMEATHEMDVRGGESDATKERLRSLAGTPALLMDELVRIDRRQEDDPAVDVNLLDTSGGNASMIRLRAIILAVLASAILAVAAPESRAGSPLPTDLSTRPIDVSVRRTAAPQVKPDPVPEPASLGLFGIGISSLITFRRFRKLFY